jgi:uncharacterized protein (UPF0332 family)
MFDWQNYLILADELNKLSHQTTTQNNISKEALRRCAVSRAYYAAFWQATRFVEQKEKSYRYEPGHGHDSLVSALKRHNQAIGKDLHSLKIRRHKADYDAQDTTFNERQTNLDLTLARKIIDGLVD